MIAAAAVDWFRAHARPLPWRAPGTTPWGVLVSEVMSHQTQIDRVVPAWTAWIERWPTPAGLAAAPPSEVLRAWDRLGYPRRALRLRQAAEAIVEQHGGAVPDDLDALLALPGIGDYTARAVAAFAYGRRHPVVDTNVRRVLARAVSGQAEAAPPSPRDLVLMESLLPADPAEAAIASAGLMELGALVCTARAPRCGDCPLAGECAWRALGHPPYAGPRRQAQPRFEGSERQLRGRIMARLREADVPVPRAGLADADADALRIDRAIEGLVADGLAVAAEGGYRLP